VISIRKFRVVSLTVGTYDLFWELDDTVEDALDYAFTVERSESPGGPWDVVSQPFRDKYMFRDMSVPGVNKWRQLFYRVKIEGAAGTAYSGLATQEAQPDLSATEARRMMNLVLKEGIGRVVWLFPVRTFGTRCPVCFDPVLGKRVSSNCLSCYGTGYARGFMAPLATYLRIDPTERADQLGQVVTQQQTTRAHTAYYPLVKPRDVLVEAENRRWRVVSSQAPERLRAPIWQGLTLHEIPPTDIEYRLPINIDDLRRVQPSPERAFTNPQTPDEAGSRLATLFDVFRSYG
jgi:hypothetical protein